MVFAKCGHATLSCLVPAFVQAWMQGASGLRDFVEVIEELFGSYLMTFHACWWLPTCLQLLEQLRVVTILLPNLYCTNGQQPVALFHNCRWQVPTYVCNVVPAGLDSCGLRMKQHAVEFKASAVFAQGMACLDVCIQGCWRWYLQFIRNAESSALRRCVAGWWHYLCWGGMEGRFVLMLYHDFAVVMWGLACTSYCCLTGYLHALLSGISRHCLDWEETSIRGVRMENAVCK